jgi:hypothetical protein
MKRKERKKEERDERLEQAAIDISSREEERWISGAGRVEVDALEWLIMLMLMLGLLEIGGVPHLELMIPFLYKAQGWFWLQPFGHGFAIRTTYLCPGT